MKIKVILIILNIAGLLCTGIWLYIKPDWEPIVTSIGLIATLITLLYSNSDSDKGDNTIMTQKGGKGSTNYQSKGDINITKS
jgi:hypothetical protein